MDDDKCITNQSSAPANNAGWTLRIKRVSPLISNVRSQIMHRETINNELGNWCLVFFLGFSIAFIGILLEFSSFKLSWLLTLPGVLIIFLSIYGMYWKIACPKCKKALSSALSTHKQGIFCSISNKLKHCPYCGVDFDSDNK